MRAAGFHVSHDGYMNDGLDDQDDSAGRVSLLLEPSDKLSIRIMADYFDQGGRGPGSTPIALDPDNRYGISSAQSGAYLLGRPSANRRCATSIPYPPRSTWTINSGA